MPFSRFASFACEHAAFVVDFVPMRGLGRFLAGSVALLLFACGGDDGGGARDSDTPGLPDDIATGGTSGTNDASASGAAGAAVAGSGGGTAAGGASGDGGIGGGAGGDGGAATGGAPGADASMTGGSAATDAGSSDGGPADAAPGSDASQPSGPDAGTGGSGVLTLSGSFGPALSGGSRMTAGVLTLERASFGTTTACNASMCFTGGFSR